MLNSFNTELQIKNSQFEIKNKMKNLLNKLRGFKWIVGLVFK